MSDFDIVSSLPLTTSIPALEACTATIADYISATQRHLLGSHGAIVNLLSANISDSAASFVLSYTTDGIGPRRIVEIDDELMYVLEVDASTKTVTVIRGYQGTTGTSHSAGAQVNVNPRYARGAIRSALRDEINSWPNSLYGIGTADVTVGTARGYDLPIGAYRKILEAYIAPATGDTTADWVNVPFTARKLVPTANFAGGNSITFNQTFTPARTVRLVYAKSFDTSSMDDSVACSTIGLFPSMSDIPPLGAAWRLVQHKEVLRIDRQSQGDPKRAEEVPTGASSGTASMFLQRRNERIAQEAARLMGLYPLRH